jgi:hypothetical protein
MNPYLELTINNDKIRIYLSSNDATGKEIKEKLNILLKAQGFVV